jgi:restriction endonuclease Mrr
VVTSGTFSAEAMARAEETEQQRGLRIELIDGEQLAALVVEGGLSVVLVRM